eukprot:5480066-Pyramimonas_sp.AAC.1
MDGFFWNVASPERYAHSGFKSAAVRCMDGGHISFKWVSRLRFPNVLQIIGLNISSSRTDEW